MKIEEKTKEEVLALLKNQDTVLCYEDMGKDIGGEFTDEDKINWFRYINFAGTPQDAEHLRSLS